MANEIVDQLLQIRRRASAFTATLQLFQKSPIAAMRITMGAKDGDLAYTAHMLREDSCLVCLQLRGHAEYPYWLNSRPTPIGPARIGQFKFLDLNLEHACYICEPIDSLVTHVSRAALDSITEENCVPKIESLNIPQVSAVDDIVIYGLGISLLPALQRPQQANRLFLDSVGTALLTHLATTYGDMRVEPPLKRGGLAPWQERRAKEVLRAHVDGNIPLEQLAAICGLSRSHFARAFKTSTGLSPHRWLIAMRIEQAQDLLLNSNLPIEEIATRCGFADQSHFSRVFASYAGSTPWKWRRIRRS